MLLFGDCLLSPLSLYEFCDERATPISGGDFPLANSSRSNRWYSENYIRYTQFWYDKLRKHMYSLIEWKRAAVARYIETTGQIAKRGHHKPFLVGQIPWRVQFLRPLTYDS